ncbi:hypothetical protein, partial [Kocuria rhizophila]|uniref:hypothetical protein n=1 Tax=Kocuria rhizophila TaxID=72000 RepID=UPI00370486EB
MTPYITTPTPTPPHPIITIPLPIPIIPHLTHHPLHLPLPLPLILHRIRNPPLHLAVSNTNNNSLPNHNIHPPTKPPPALTRHTIHYTHILYDP